MANSVTEWIVETTIKHLPSHGPGFGRQVVDGLIEAKKFRPDNIHLTVLASSIFGPTWETKLRRLSSLAQWVGESTEAQDLTAWRDIVGAVSTEAIETGYQQAVSPVEQLVGNWQSQDDDPNNELLIPYPSAAVDASKDVAPGMEYPKTGFTHYSIVAPVPVKHGLIAQLTLEVAKANRKKQFLDSLGEVGRVVGLEEVRRKLRIVLGITKNYTTVTPDGTRTTRDTYVTTAGSANLISNLNLANGPSEIDRLERMFADMKHPLTGEPIDIVPTGMFTTRGNKYSLSQAAMVEEIRVTSGSTVNISGNPVSFSGPIMTDVRAQRLLETEAGIEGGALSAAEAATFTAVGDLPAAFKWRLVHALMTFEAGPGDMNELGEVKWPPAFYQDVVYACKARWWGCPFVYDPYRVVAAYKSD
jgi:hypothetical protein